MVEKELERDSSSQKDNFYQIYKRVENFVFDPFVYKNIKFYDRKLFRVLIIKKVLL